MATTPQFQSLLPAFKRKNPMAPSPEGGPAFAGGAAPAPEGGPTPAPPVFGPPGAYQGDQGAPQDPAAPPEATPPDPRPAPPPPAPAITAPPVRVPGQYGTHRRYSRHPDERFSQEAAPAGDPGAAAFSAGRRRERGAQSPVEQAAGALMAPAPQPSMANAHVDALYGRRRGARDPQSY